MDFSRQVFCCAEQLAASSLIEWVWFEQLYLLIISNGESLFSTEFYIYISDE